MSLHPIDMTVIAAYIGLTLLIGFWISTRAKKGLRSYGSQCVITWAV